jgi:hypothetical protein
MPERSLHKTTCPICKNACAALEKLNPPLVDCQLCGKFTITPALVTVIDGEPRPYLSAATRKACKSGPPLFLGSENWERLEQQQRSIRVSEKLDDLLRLIAEGSEVPGRGWRIKLAFDYPLIAAFNQDELKFYLSELETAGLVWPPTTGDVGWGLTIKGWERVQPIARPGGIPGRCFVAMWFSTDTTAAYESGIEPAVREAGFIPIRIDLKEHNNEIPDEIIAEIRNCEFMVADFTGQRAGVYYEAGFAMGLGRRVIWCCRQDQIGQLHFDTNHKNHIPWTTPEELYKRLYRRIRATILEQG